MIIFLKFGSPFYAQNRKTEFKKGENGYFGQTNGQIGHFSEMIKCLPFTNSYLILDRKSVV